MQGFLKLSLFNADYQTERTDQALLYSFLISQNAVERWGEGMNYKGL